jgi:hypothetical protein
MSRMQIRSPRLFLRITVRSRITLPPSFDLRCLLSPPSFHLPHISILVLSSRYKFAIGGNGGDKSNVQWRAEPADHFHSHHLSCVFAWLKDRWGRIHSFKLLLFYSRRNNLLYAVHKEQSGLRGGKEKICGSHCLVWKFILNLVPHACEISHSDSGNHFLFLHKIFIQNFKVYRPPGQRSLLFYVSETCWNKECFELTSVRTYTVPRTLSHKGVSNGDWKYTLTQKYLTFISERCKTAYVGQNRLSETTLTILALRLWENLSRFTSSPIKSPNQLRPPSEEDCVHNSFYYEVFYRTSHPCLWKYRH